MKSRSWGRVRGGAEGGGGGGDGGSDGGGGDGDGGHVPVQRRNFALRKAECDSLRREQQGARLRQEVRKHLDSSGLVT